ncbi:hypothetical protein MCOR25_011237 [Pyricularia grisea]|uniref:Uncharacterized protein n=1 Tax=Pyricularia grisea TaxID=148305 RepID=A0A6P8BB02_PYRGI|nr:uncharacterized protein PgNI_02651 [Pyricularia grisea]KAI6339829.1 hypothetical protein MCOR25_011237 [Pyricularia grisea]TLD13005.1 hypothetical protein PgNI_02651 [Pyricularia grisea]
MFRTYAVLGSLALAAFIYPVAALPLEPRDPQQQNPGSPGINIPPSNNQPGFNLGPGGFNFGNPESGGGGVSLGPDGLKISPGNGQPGITVGTGQPAQPAPKPPRRVLDDQDLKGEDD